MTPSLPSVAEHVALLLIAAVMSCVVAWLTARRDRSAPRRSQAEARLRFLDDHDALTGLANRRALLAQAGTMLQEAEAAGDRILVLALDIDRFKTVNDMLGHRAGDLLLQHVAKRLRSTVREDDVIARVSGNAFVVILREAPAQAAAVAGEVASRLIEAVSRSYNLDGAPVSIGASVGIASFPNDGETIEAVLQSADLALYQAKTHGRGGICLFEADMGRAERERRVLEHDLAIAIASDGLQLAFQPLFTSAGTGVVAFEALARWQHPTRGLVSPVTFIPLAEQTGLIIPLGRWVMEQACRTAVTWLRPCRVAVNVSARQVRAGNLPATVADILARTGLPASRLELEVTESLLIDDAEQALATLQAIKALGVRIVLDDFGTGYSGLAYLQRFPFDMVKIDKSFTDRITTDAGTRAIVSAIVALSHQLDLQVTAEGVETDDQLQELRREACDHIQGFLLGKPMAADRIAGFLDQNEAA